MDPTVVQRLRGVPIFAALADEALGRVAAVVTEFEAPAGHVLTQPGQEGSGMFVLVEGTVTVELPGGATVALGPGEFFGELSVLDGEPRTAAVISDEPTSCLAIPSWKLDALLESQPRVTIALLRGVARRLREVTEEHRH